jgi:hypothetical protein
VADLLFAEDGSVVYAFPGLGAELKSRARDPLADDDARVRGALGAGPTGSVPSTALITAPSTALITYSPRRRTIAGLLQIIPALVGFGGIGRLYSGHVFLGLVQMFLGPFGGVGLAWSIIDGLLTLLRGKTRDSKGRLLRPD